MTLDVPHFRGEIITSERIVNIDSMPVHIGPHIDHFVDGIMHTSFFGPCPSFDVDVIPFDVMIDDGPSLVAEVTVELAKAYAHCSHCAFHYSCIFAPFVALCSIASSSTTENVFIVKTH